MMHASDFRKIDLVCSQDEDRPELQNVYLREGHLYAADGFIAARIPVATDEEDSDGPIPVRAITMACETNSTLAAKEKTVIVYQADCHFGRISTQRQQAIQKKLDSAVLDRLGTRPETHEPIIILDAQRLWTLAQAICESGPWLEFYLGQTSHDPVLVKPLNCHDDTLAVIMPMCSRRSLIGSETESEKADIWQILARLREHIDNDAEKVCLADDLLNELRKALCVKQNRDEK